MSRMIWVALGAAGGIIAYRKGQQVAEEARKRGVVGSLQAASGSAAGLAQGTRSLVGKALAPTPTSQADAPAASRPSGTAAARALAEARRAGSTGHEPDATPTARQRSERTG